MQRLLVCLTMLSAVCLVGQAAAIEPPPQLDLWEQQMLRYGQQHCNTLADHTISWDTRSNATYYDGERVYYQIGDYTGNPYWAQSCAQEAEFAYRDQYVMAQNPAGAVPGYWVFPHGLWMDSKRTGDGISTTAVTMLSQNAAFANAYTAGTDVSSTTYSREVAYALQAKLLARDLGATNLDAAINWFAQTALGHFNQWFVTKTAPYMQPFMVGLTSEALINYYKASGDSRVPTAIAQAMDGLWNGTLADGTGRPLWDTASQSFYYIDRAVASEGGASAIKPAPDLNMLIAPAYAWLYRQTNNSVWKDRGDQVFAGGVLGEYVDGAKQYDQSYRWSFDYIQQRLSVPDPLDATPPMLLEITSATQANGSVTVSWKTNEFADTQLEYGPTDSYGAVTTLNPLLVRAHLQTVSGLTPGSTYHFRVKSRDASGNLGVSGDYTVTAASADTVPPALSAIKAAEVKPWSATIVWMTNEPADSAVEFGTTTAYGTSYSDARRGVFHTIALASSTLPWLQDSTLYHYRATSRDDAGNVSVSPDMTFYAKNPNTGAAPPSVTLVSPPSPASGAITFPATVLDSSPWIAVQLQENGVPIGLEVTTPPYNVSWDTSRASNGVHTLTVAARNADGRITVSAPVSITVNNLGSGSSLPTVPSNLTASPVGQKITLAWGASTGQNTVTGYEIDRCLGAGCTTFVLLTSVPAPGYTDANVSVNTSYSYRVRAVDSLGQRSGDSNVATAKTAALDNPPTTPAGLTATAASSARINLAWTASTDDIGISGYQIDRCAGAGCTGFVMIATASSNAYADGTVAASTSYSYRVRALDTAGQTSGNSNVATAATPAAPPMAPTNLSATAASSTQVTLAWTASSSAIGVSSYQVERCSGSGCASFAPLGTTAAAGYTDATAAAGTTYGYRVKALDTASQSSGYSNVASATTPALTPPPPTGGIATSGAWGFNEGSGTATADASGNGLTGTLNGGTTWTAGKVGTALTFNGTTGYVSVSSNLVSPLGGTASMAFWIKTSQVGNNTSWLAPGVSGVEQAGGTNDVFWGWLDGAGRIAVSAGNGAAAKSTNRINDNTWHYVVLTRDAGTGQVRVYVDGQLNGTATSETGTKTTPFSSLGRIQNTGGAPHYLNGSLDEVSLYSRVLTPTDVQTLYGPTAPPPAVSPLVLSWKLDEGSGSSTADASGSGNTGTLVNSPVWTAGQSGQALNFAGTSGYVVDTSTKNLNLAAGLTIAVWVKPASFPFYSNVLLKGSDNIRGYGLNFNYARLNFVKMGFDDVASTVTFTTGVWQHAAITWDQVTGTVKFYRNGVVAQTVLAPQAVIAPTNPDRLILGAWLDTTNQFQGVIDDARIYNRALTDTELLQVYNGAGP